MTANRDHRPPRAGASRREICLVIAALWTGLPAQVGNPPPARFAVCVWHATDIVVAGEAKTINGDFEVLEVWAGKLKRGASIRVPGMEAMAAPSRRRVDGPGPAGRPRTISCDRVVLFLRREEGSFLTANRRQLPSKGGETPRFEDRDVTLSAAWIDQGKVFTHADQDPESALVPLPIPETRFRAQILRLRAEHDVVRSMKTIHPVGRRIAAMERFRQTCSKPTKTIILRNLLRIGRPAQKTLTRLLHDLDGIELHGEIVRALTGMLGPAAADILVRTIRQDLELLRQVSTRRAAAHPAPDPKAETHSTAQDRALAARERRMTDCLYCLWSARCRFDPRLIREIPKLRAAGHVEISEQALRISEGLLKAESLHLAK